MKCKIKRAKIYTEEKKHTDTQIKTPEDLKWMFQQKWQCNLEGHLTYQVIKDGDLNNCQVKAPSAHN